MEMENTVETNLFVGLLVDIYIYIGIDTLANLLMKITFVAL